MTHWMSRVGVGVLPLVSLFGAASAFAADPPAHTALHAAHVKPPASNTKTAPVKPSAGSQVMLNPQPIPPGKSATGPVTTGGGAKVMLNPQPIPPGKTSAGPVTTGGGAKVMLNPQPIPPGKTSAGPTKTNGGDKAIIFVGGKSSKLKTAPKIAAPRTAG